MPRGNVDIFTSRRDNFLECEYWLVNQKITDPNFDREKIVNNNMPSGKFFAKYESAIENNNSVIGQTFMFSKTETSISTEDCVDDIKRNALIRINKGLIWRVDSISQKPIKNNFQFDTAIKFKTYLELRR